MSNRATISWNANSEPDLAGYRIYASQRENALALFDDLTLAELSNPALPSVTYWNFQSYGRWFFAVSAYDTSDNESQTSAIVSKLIGGDDSFAGATL